MNLRFHKTYFLLFVLIFITEVLIALYVHDDFIRPYFGDVLVVILIYCFVKAFLNIRTLTAATGILLFAFIVETLQYLKFIELVGLQDVKLARVVIGTSFAWMDIWCYVAGFAIILITEHLLTNKNKKD
ncbi:DUF2809 domain-containing protein [Flavobacterium sp. J372]|uniref:ribosomal maturation YjgA family protein n=1 Tax=Flavobacterium sp. J372 TaxID=2898436 RepID=UPI002150A242|nr:DUF2809 domain-containing protein [Flavobacterium sp. J372]MCR5862719.1 DUF2809 domain-containing protein [Flavobacterium sp. J372]